MADAGAHGESAAARRGPALDRHRLLAMARKEWIQLTRDPRSLTLAFALPVLLLVLFGTAITWDVRNVELIVVDEDRSALSRSLTEAFTSSGHFRLVGRRARAAEIAGAFERGEARIAVVVPPGFQADVAAGSAAPLQAIVDGSDANTATIALGYVRAVIQQWSVREASTGRPARLPLVADSRVWFNEDLASRNMIVPGLVAVIMAIIAAMLTSLTLAREWERGTMEQLASTPVTRLEVVLGKLLPYAAIGLADVAVTSALGVALFGVPFRGSALLLGGLSLCFVLGALGLGLFISAVAKSQMLATQISMVASFLPAFLLSGFMFAIDVMPPPLQAVSMLVPARHFLVVTRGVFLKGVGLDVLWVQAAIMVAFAALGVGLAVRAFRKELSP
uniref:ABC transporter permease n=1 Tax=Eiseniibacteriota bacterium TaxID=2212470 RepID=A0A832I3P2_UNCEI